MWLYKQLNINRSKFQLYCAASELKIHYVLTV